MTRILVNPERLRALGAELQRALNELRATEQRAVSAWNGLDWEARQRAGAENQVNLARQRADSLASQTETLARYLANKAQAFEEADRQGTQSISSVSRQWTQWQTDYQAMRGDLTTVRESQWWQDTQSQSWTNRYQTRDQLLREVEQADILCSSSPLTRIHELDAQIKQLESKRWFWKDDALEAEIVRVQDLKLKYERYYVLNDQIKQGITANGPSSQTLLQGLEGCTYYAATRRDVTWPTPVGNGGQWADTAQAAGWDTGAVPIRGALISFDTEARYFDEGYNRNVNADSTYGHIAYVENVDWSRGDVVRIEISEGNSVPGGKYGDGPGTVREHIWITLDRGTLNDGHATFIYESAHKPTN